MLLTGRQVVVKPMWGGRGPSPGLLAWCVIVYDG